MEDVAVEAVRVLLREALEKEAEFAEAERGSVERSVEWRHGWLLAAVRDAAEAVG